MNVLHTISSLGINAGGPPLSTTLTVKGLRALGVNAEILTCDVASPDDENILVDDYIHFLPPPAEQKFAYSNAFGRYLEGNKYELYHVQGIWQYPAYITAKKARKSNTPYVITPRGMLYPQEFERSGMIKKLALATYQKRDLQLAACIHATCDQEMQHLRDLGITAPIAVIPNPIEAESLLEQEVSKPDTIRFGYLGRIHPRKKVERILYAWDKLRTSTENMEMVIIGAGDAEYHNFLKQEAERLQLGNVEFTGFLSGKKKEQKLVSISCLVVPSNFENFGMVIAEALVRGIPVITSKGTPWQELDTHSCGWWVENDVNTLAKTMEEAMLLSDEERVSMGRKGKRLIRDNYSIGMVAQKMKGMYDWVLGNSAKPDYIYLQN